MAVTGAEDGWKLRMLFSALVLTFALLVPTSLPLPGANGRTVPPGTIRVWSEAQIPPKSHRSVLCQVGSRPSCQVPARAEFRGWGSRRWSAAMFVARRTAIPGTCVRPPPRCVTGRRVKSLLPPRMGSLLVGCVGAALGRTRWLHHQCLRAHGHLLSAPSLFLPGSHAAGGGHPQGPAGAQGEGVHGPEAVRGGAEGGVLGLHPLHGPHPGVPPGSAGQHQVLGASKLRAAVMGVEPWASICPLVRSCTAQARVRGFPWGRCRPPSEGQLSRAWWGLSPAPWCPPACAAVLPGVGWGDPHLPAGHHHTNHRPPPHNRRPSPSLQGAVVPGSARRELGVGEGSARVGTSSGCRAGCGGGLCWGRGLPPGQHCPQHPGVLGLQAPPGCGPVQPAVGDPASAGGLDWVTHRGPCQPWTVCDSVILWCSGNVPLGLGVPSTSWAPSRAAVPSGQPARCSSCGTVLVPAHGHVVGITARLRRWPLGNQVSIWPRSVPAFQFLL